MNNMLGTSRPSTGFSQQGHKSKCIDGFSYPIGIIASGIYGTYDKIIEKKKHGTLRGDD